MVIPQSSPECAVLYCQNLGTSRVISEALNTIEALVCKQHREEIDRGDVWDWNEGLILMRNDVPLKLQSMGSSKGKGSRGFTLALETEQDRFEVFLSPSDADQLITLLQTQAEDL